ncbi:hypothetical protein SXCC_03453 [Gluconacetobacter sp. SXCC-1]|nr:hypothetical protein SXCC_03453 [Gluconacetobacter sp. SXCC-1]
MLATHQTCPTATPATASPSNTTGMASLRPRRDCALVHAFITVLSSFMTAPYTE